MNKLLNLSKVQVPLPCINEVCTFLRKRGRSNLEGVALWAGIITDTTFEVKKTIIPEQEAYILDEGLLYSVDGEELHRINVWLYANKMTLIAQIHSHPRRAYHSETDDQYPIIAVNGGLSIVIPDFAFRPFSLRDWAIYRLYPQRMWKFLEPAQVSELIKII